MTKTRELIEAEYKANIESIRERHHERGEINHEEYHQLLNKDSERVDRELIAYGYVKPPAGSIEEKSLRDEIRALNSRVKTLEEKEAT